MTEDFRSGIKKEIENRIYLGDFRFRWHYIRDIADKKFVSIFRKIFNRNKYMNFIFLKGIDSKEYYYCNKCFRIILEYKDEEDYFDNCPNCYRKIKKGRS